jgi:hypothetical protein
MPFSSAMPCETLDRRILPKNDSIPRMSKVVHTRASRSAWPENSPNLAQLFKYSLMRCPGSFTSQLCRREHEIEHGRAVTVLNHAARLRPVRDPRHRGGHAPLQDREGQGYQASHRYAFSVVYQILPSLSNVAPGRASCSAARSYQLTSPHYRWDRRSRKLPAKRG